MKRQPKTNLQRDKKQMIGLTVFGQFSRFARKHPFGTAVPHSSAARHARGLQLRPASLSALPKFTFCPLALLDVRMRCSARYAISPNPPCFAFPGSAAIRTRAIALCAHVRWPCPIVVCTFVQAQSAYNRLSRAYRAKRPLSGPLKSRPNGFVGF